MIEVSAKVHMKDRWIYWGTGIFLVISLIVSAIFSSGTLEIGTDASLGDTQREEVQRYFGYELLLFRYLTLPFDVSMNVNQKGDFVDIGFLFLICIPIFLFTLIRKRPLPLIISSLIFLFLLIISMGHSNMVNLETLQLVEGEQRTKVLLNSRNFANAPFTVILANIYLLFFEVSQPIDAFFSQFSDDRDFISYPILLSIFLLASFFMFRFFEGRNQVVKWVVILAWIYGFFWFILASGIIWYGYLLFALGFALLVLGSDQIFKNLKAAKFLQAGFYCLAGLWLIVSFISRISNITFQTPVEHHGKGLLLPSVFRYNIGEIPSETKVLEGLIPGLPRALTVMNTASNDKVWRVGTSLNYFIRNNHKRVYQDNQLGAFQRLHEKYQEPQIINEVLIASDIRFLIIDLNTTSLDNTPEKSLTRKYNNLMQYVENNPGLTLLATDRVLSGVDNTGKSILYYGVFGEKVSGGTYAIYRVN